MVRLNRPPVNYTGEGFKGEKVLAIAATVLTIASTLLLIHLCFIQREQLTLEIEALKNKKAEDEAKAKANTQKT